MDTFLYIILGLIVVKIVWNAAVLYYIYRRSPTTSVELSDEYRYPLDDND